MIWRPLETLPPGHYGIGQLQDGSIANIYRAGEALVLNVETGMPVDLTGWQHRQPAKR